MLASVPATIVEPPYRAVPPARRMVAGNHAGGGGGGTALPPSRGVSDVCVRDLAAMAQEANPKIRWSLCFHLGPFDTIKAS